MTHHWLPRQGSPDGLAERITQMLIRLLALLPVYLSVVTTLTLVLVWMTR